jgi:uncharacterized paraquat-inducible protein A
MYCWNCGHALNEKTALCPACGKALQPPQKPGLNLLAALGLVCAFLPVPLLGLVLSVAGLAQCARDNQRGRGFALAGIALSVVSMLVWAVLLMIVFGWIVPFTEGLVMQSDWYQGMVS